MLFICIMCALVIVFLMLSVILKIGKLLHKNAPSIQNKIISIKLLNLKYKPKVTLKLIKNVSRNHSREMQLIWPHIWTKLVPIQSRIWEKACQHPGHKTELEIIFYVYHGIYIFLSVCPLYYTIPFILRKKM